MTSVQADTLLTAVADLQNIGQYLLSGLGILAGLLLVVVLAVTWKG